MCDCKLRIIILHLHKSEQPHFTSVPHFSKAMRGKQLVCPTENGLIPEARLHYNTTLGIHTGRNETVTDDGVGGEMRASYTTACSR